MRVYLKIIYVANDSQHKLSLFVTHLINHEKDIELKTFISPNDDTNSDDRYRFISGKFQIKATTQRSE